MPIQATRTLLDAALSGELDAVEYRVEPTFGIEVPIEVPGVDSTLLDPRRPGPIRMRTTRRRRSSRRCSVRTSRASTASSPAWQRPALAPSRRPVLTHGSHSRGYKGRVAHPIMRRLAVLLSGALLLVALALAPSREPGQPATSAARSRRTRPPSSARAGSPAPRRRSTAVRPRRRRARPSMSSSPTRSPSRRRRPKAGPSSSRTSYTGPSSHSCRRTS